MKLKQILAMAVIATASVTSSYANPADLGGDHTFTSQAAWSGLFLPAGQSFDDLVNFTAWSSGQFDFVSHGYNYTNATATVIDNVSHSTIASLTYGVDPGSGQFVFTGSSTLISGRSYSLHLTGTTDSTGLSSYNGTITAVPEPETVAMLLAGLGLVGLTARRRRKFGAA